jgi:hypothetical protein
MVDQHEEAVSRARGLGVPEHGGQRGDEEGDEGEEAGGQEDAPTARREHGIAREIRPDPHREGGENEEQRDELRRRRELGLHGRGTLVMEYGMIPVIGARGSRAGGEEPRGRRER